MIFASHKNKGFVARPADATDTNVSNPVEQTLREAAAWEPLCPPPADFADFTKRALKKQKRAPFPPPSSRPAPATQWVLGLRAPLTASLALGLVWWVGGSGNDLPAPEQTREAAREIARPFTGEKSIATNGISPTTKKSGPLVQTPQKAPSAVLPVLTDSVSVSPSHSAPISHNARIRRHKRPAEERLATQNAKQTNPAPLWKTETVERPAWGALIPATFACTTPASDEPGQESSENETTLMPVVLDVALPESALVAANGPSSTDTPPPSTAP